MSMKMMFKSMKWRRSYTIFDWNNNQVEAPIVDETDDEMTNTFIVRIIKV